MVEETEILRARARELARRIEPPAAAGTVLDVLEFRLAQERYVIETRYVQEVHRLTSLTRVPCTPPFVAGIVNVRGRIVPVLDLKKLFELPDAGLTDLHRVVLLEGDGFEVGLLTDTIVEVRPMAAAAVQPPPATFTGIREAYVKGVTADGTIVLDVQRIVSDPRIIVNEDVQG